MATEEDLMDNPHYNYPLTRDRHKFVHYYRNAKPYSFGVRWLPYGMTIRGFGWTAIWVLWPRD